MTWGEHLFDTTVPPITSFTGEWYTLSNFWKSPVSFRGDTYATAEHAYQSAKACTEADRLHVKHAPTPADAKKIGRDILSVDGWNEIRVNVMREVLTAKFSLSTPEGVNLLLTGSRELVEGNTWGDRFWGVCEGEGSNQLGRVLMEIRYVNTFTRMVDCDKPR